MKESADVKRIRAAVVQFDYQPSAVLNYPFIEEPALLGEGERGITSLYLPVQGVEKQIKNFREEVAKAYEEFTSERVCNILERLNEMDVNIVVFPEYSIPANCLSAIDESAGKMVVIAASHTVRDSLIEETYKHLGLNVTSEDIGRSICPIRLSPKNWGRIDKLTKSKWETPLKIGAKWETFKIKINNINRFFSKKCSYPQKIHCKFSIANLAFKI